MFDLIIIGGGPAGSAAAVYAARKRLKTLLIVPEFGGQSIVSDGIQNWIGTISISGDDLAKSLKEHVAAYAQDTVTVLEKEYVTSVAKDSAGFSVTTDKNSYAGKTVLVASGASRRKLDVPGAAQFENKGISYCASCDGPLFAGQDVAVIGGGNAGFESAAQLLAYAKSVTLLNRSDMFKADEVTVAKVLANPHMKGLLNAEILEVTGDAFVTGVTYKDGLSGEKRTLAVSGIFVEIGLIPNTDFIADLVARDAYKRIVIDPWTQRTNVAGVWAAGDCSSVHYHQNNIAAGDGVKALEDIYLFIKTGK